MPHCWPQKQQCVLTRRSGSTLVDSRTPLIDDRCGPKRSMMPSAPAGILAIFGLLQHAGAGITPQRALRETEQRTAAAGAHLLIVAALTHLVPEPELPFDNR